MTSLSHLRQACFELPEKGIVFWEPGQVGTREVQDWGM